MVVEPVCSWETGYAEVTVLWDYMTKEAKKLVFILELLTICMRVTLLKKFGMHHKTSVTRQMLIMK